MSATHSVTLQPKIIQGLNEFALAAVGAKDAGVRVVAQRDVGAPLRRHLVRRLTDKLAATKSNCTITGFSISVGGQVVEMILTVEMLQTSHGDSLYHLHEGRRVEKSLAKYELVLKTKGME